MDETKKPPMPEYCPYCGSTKGFDWSDLYEMWVCKNCETPQ